MAQAAAGFGGQGFSLKGGGDRFVLPADMRNAIAHASGDRVLNVGLHESWPCLVGFGGDRVAQFDAILDEQQAEARANGEPFNRALRKANLWSFKRHLFDASGRFVMNPSSIKLGKITDQIYFHGVGDVITMWNPQVLLGLGDEFAVFKIYCEQEMEEALAKADKGGKGK